MTYIKGSIREGVPLRNHISADIDTKKYKRENSSAITRVFESLMSILFNAQILDQILI